MKQGYVFRSLEDYGKVQGAESIVDAFWLGTGLQLFKTTLDEEDNNHALRPIRSLKWSEKVMEIWITWVVHSTQGGIGYRKTASLKAFERLKEGRFSEACSHAFDAWGNTDYFSLTAEIVLRETILLFDPEFILD